MSEKIPQRLTPVHPRVEAAKREFLSGTGCASPHTAIQRGLRTTEQWCDVLARHREAGTA